MTRIEMQPTVSRREREKTNGRSTSTSVKPHDKSEAGTRLAFFIMMGLMALALLYFITLLFFI